MRNKFKVKKKLVAIALALVLAAQPLCAFPMNVFAGTGKNGVIKAPTVAVNFELAKIIELRNGEKFDVNDHVTIIKAQDATVSYTVESQTVFSGSGNLLDDSGQVQNPGIAKVKVTVGGASKETYIIADINAMLKFPCQNFSVSASNAASEAVSAASMVVGNSLMHMPSRTASLIEERLETGFDIVSTTMSGYTDYSPHLEGPDFDLIRRCADQLRVPVIAEGKIHYPEDLKKAFECGAFSAVVGGAITRPQEITARFVKILE